MDYLGPYEKDGIGYVLSGAVGPLHKTNVKSKEITMSFASFDDSVGTDRIFTVGGEDHEVFGCIFDRKETVAASAAKFNKTSFTERSVSFTFSAALIPSFASHKQ